MSSVSPQLREDRRSPGDRWTAFVGRRVASVLGWLPLAFGLASALAAAQPRGSAPGRLPLAAHGLVHRATFAGCGQAWDLHEAWTLARLEIDRSGRAELVLDSEVARESATVSGLLDHRPHHAVRRSVRHVAWSGRARREAHGVRVSLQTLDETTDQEGSVTSRRSRLAATLACSEEARDVMSATPPVGTIEERPVARRPLLACAFAARPAHDRLPAPVADLLTLPFLLADGAGITTDARYEGGFAFPAPFLVAREPGGLVVPRRTTSDEGSGP